MVFPVKVPYTVSADITKYQGAPFNEHPDFFYLIQKKSELIQRPGVFAQLHEASHFVTLSSAYCGKGAIDSIDV